VNGTLAMKVNPNTILRQTDLLSDTGMLPDGDRSITLKLGLKGNPNFGLVRTLTGIKTMIL
jgi:hypothetical protein